jgi:hypothetical protein
MKSSFFVARTESTSLAELTSLVLRRTLLGMFASRTTQLAMTFRSELIAADVRT